ncbi:MAG: Mut7-C RNAse domain-containing protein [Xenococcaceae cyanobacterium MO_207.B15]|nr:Mut7-C RNAse domain-containing protein [Xenococcaceae cyanobacterium MO_207.B15]
MRSNQVYFRFYGSLNDFLPSFRRQQDFRYLVRGNPSIKDTIEANGVPHPEVELILANGQSVDFSYSLQDGDRFSVYPHFTSLSLGSRPLLRPQLSLTRFVLDVHLGKLATYLRLLGFDTWYRYDCDDQELAAISDSQQRILLTRDRGLLKRRIVTYGYWVRAIKPIQQTREILHRFALFAKIQPFRRCLRCNGDLVSVELDDVSARLPVLTRQYYDEFFLCQKCQQVYWKGAHYSDLQQLVEQLSN